MDWNDSDRVVVAKKTAFPGETVFIDGYPLGVRKFAVCTVQSVEIKRKDADNAVFYGLASCSSFLNKGASGSPVFNVNGEVVGIMTHLAEGLGNKVYYTLLPDALSLVGRPGPWDEHRTW